MKRHIISASKFFLSMVFLFSLFTIAKADDYELIIITPHKYETVAQSFLSLHDDGSDWTIHGVYATVEDIFARYDQLPSGVEEPSIAGEPDDISAPGEAQIGKDYENDVSLSIIKFLRGILLFREAGQEDDFVGSTNRRAFEFAFDVLKDKNGASISIGYGDAKFKYLLLLGDTGAAGPVSVTLSGVPESWYVYMDPADDEQIDRTYFPTDFFYSSPDYYDGVDWTPDLIVGRIPVHNSSAASHTGNVTELIVVDPADIVPTPPYTPEPGLVECDVCDTYRTGGGPPGTPRGAFPTAGIGLAGKELWIVSDGDPPPGGELAPIGATYLILSNTDTCVRVLGDPGDDDVEEETEDGADDGDGYEIHDAGLAYAQAIYNKCAAYDAEVKTAGAWDTWYRKVVTAGGDSQPYLFSFWDEFVLADITNQGFFEGNEIIKLRHTNKDDGIPTNNFTVTSLAPYLNGTDCGLIFLLGIGDADELLFDDGIMDTTLVLSYTSGDSRIPIVVSGAGTPFNGSGRFDMPLPFEDSFSFGASVVESAGNGGGIAFIGSTDSAFSGIIPEFNNGILSQERLYFFDELLSYTMESFHSHPKYLGDIFTGSPDLFLAGGGPINRFVESNIDDEGELSWFEQKTIFEYTLLGDPCLPVPYPINDTIETATLAPGLTLASLRGRTPQYESHDIGVDEIPTGGSASTTVNITEMDGADPVRTVPEVKITRIDIRRDTADLTWYTQPSPVPASYTFTTPNTEPGYYFVKVEQPGWDNLTSDWSTNGVSPWFEKETWIYVQEVNQFTKTPANDILVVDDDWGYPIVTYPGLFALSVYGYEDWYLRTLDILPQSYDIWHVDFDDSLDYASTGDDWAGADADTALMHGEVYNNLLTQYEKVIWLTGDPAGYWRPGDDLLTVWIEWLIETLTSDEQARLIEYLYSDGRLFLSGQGILYDLGCSGVTEEHADHRFCERKHDSLPIQNAFLTNYLHITDIVSMSARGYLPDLKNISGNPVISGNYTLDIAGYDGAENQFLFADAEPDVDTPIVSRIFEYTSLGGLPEDVRDTPFLGTAGTAYYRGRGAHVFLPWGFEAIDEQLHRNEVLAAILSWLDNPTRTGEGTEPGAPDEDGEGGGPGSLPGCFIATACYGTPMSSEVRALSTFRDEYLLSNSLGRIFVENYYKFSPRISEYISKHPILKKFMRAGLKPLVRLCEKLVE